MPSRSNACAWPGRASCRCSPRSSPAALFILPTFHLYAAGLISGALALCVILLWLWTGTAMIPEKPAKDVGLGLTLPLYASGPRSVGWWAMFITMLGDMTAFASLVFAYFFFWTIHADFPPPASLGPGLAWPMLGLIALLGAWLLTVAARHWNGRGDVAAMRGALAGGSGARRPRRRGACWRARGSRGSTRPPMSIRRWSGFF